MATKQTQSAVTEAQKATGSAQEKQTYASTKTETRVNTQDTGSCEQKYEARGGDKDWELAKKKTDEAEAAARKVQIESCKAGQAVEGVSTAERTQQEAWSRKTEAERAAEQMKGKTTTEPQQMNLAQTMDKVGEKEREVQATKRAVADAEAERRAKAGEADRTAASVNEKEQLVASLESQYERLQREKDDAAKKYKDFKKAAEEAASDVHGLRQDVHKLTDELERTGEIIRQKERELAEARQESTRVSARLGNLKDELAAAEKDNDHLQNEVKKYYKRMEDRKAQEADIADRLSKVQSEYNSAQKVVQAKLKEAEKARAAADNLKKTVGPASKDLEDVRAHVAQRERELAEAEANAKQYESQYSALLREAEQQNRVGAAAATTIEKKTAMWREMKAEIERLRKEEDAKWAEAKRHGDRADDKMTKEFEAMEARLGKAEKESKKVDTYTETSSYSAQSSGKTSTTDGNNKEIVKSSYNASSNSSAGRDDSSSNPIKTVFGRFTESDVDDTDLEAEKAGLRLL